MSAKTWDRARELWHRLELGNWHDASHQVRVAALRMVEALEAAGMAESLDESPQSGQTDPG